MKINAPLDERHDVFEGKSDKWYFNLKAANHQTILPSQGYSSKKGAEAGTSAVKRATPNATVIEV